MNQGQEQFYHFIIARVLENKQDEAKELLEYHFQKQETGTFTQDDITSLIPRITELLRPDKVQEVKAVMQEFSDSFQRRGQATD